MEMGLVIGLILLWIVVLLNLFLTLAIIRRLNLSSWQTGLRQGQIAPDFTAQTLSEESVTLQDYAGHPTAFVFISTRCSHCEKLLPELESLGPHAMRAGINLVLVSDNQREEIQDYARRNNIHLPVLIAPRSENPFFQNYQVKGTPFYCYIDQQGKVQSAGHPHITEGAWKVLADDWAKKTISV